MCLIKDIKFKLLLILFIFNLPLSGQKLEPRLLTNIPVGTNFLLAGYSYSTGNTLLDPAVPIEDLNSRLHALYFAYVRSINLFGFAGKIDAIIPYAAGEWYGKYMGADSSTTRNGFGDPLFRISVNFVGAPALKLKEYSTYKQETIVGASVQVRAPLGQYFPDRLINLGSNRWMVRSQLGISHHTGDWFYEGYVGLWLFTGNDDFWGGNTLEQKPLYAIKGHLIHTFSTGMWIDLGVAYGTGGRSYVNDLPSDTYLSTFLFGADFALPIDQQHFLKLTLLTSARLERGADINAISLGYRYLWW